MKTSRVQSIFSGIILLTWIGIFIHSSDLLSHPVYWKTVASDSGWFAWALLVFTIFIGLACKIFPRVKVFKKIRPFRKYTGIFAFLIGISHGVLRLFYEKTSENIPSIQEYMTTDTSMIFATIGGICMILPFLTSTIWAVKKMGPKLWKKIQQLSHLSFISVSFHLLFVGYAKTHILQYHDLIPLCLYLCGYGYLFIARRRKERSQKETLDQ